MRHNIASISDGSDRTVLVTCSCGAVFRGVDRGAARGGHKVHAEAIATARQAVDRACQTIGGDTT